MRCEHLCGTTTRYDHAEKELSFLLVCAVCGTQELIETIAYEPRFTEDAIGDPPGSPRNGSSAATPATEQSARLPYRRAPGCPA
jgi:hypothetical protein